MKYKINGIITLPAGMAQADELEIDSPEIEIMTGHQSGNGVDGQANVEIGVRYTYMQGSVEIEREATRGFIWDDLNDDQKTAIQTLTIEAWKLLLSIPDHTGATEV